MRLRSVPKKIVPRRDHRAKVCFLYTSSIQSCFDCKRSKYVYTSVLYGYMNVLFIPVCYTGT
ncbi:hypothetical protein HanIR_Chr12g0563561 [Helianthus annuus]|nr:hypothetical protein HanIR_Chr12g0563561 [Helianthus annuus]